MARTYAARNSPSAPAPSASAGYARNSSSSKKAASKTPPSAPPRPAAVDLALPPEAEIAVEEARRRGRGAPSNATGRYEPLARVNFDDGWQQLEDLPPFQTTV